MTEARKVKKKGQCVNSDTEQLLIRGGLSGHRLWKRTSFFDIELDYFKMSWIMTHACQCGEDSLRIKTVSLMALE